MRLEDAIPPPLVQGTPVLGSALPMLTDPLGFLRRAYEKYGDMFFVKVAHRRYVVMAGPDANKFLAENGKDCFTSDGFWGPALQELECPHSFIGVDGEAHHYQRQLMRPYFAKSKFAPKISAFAQIFQETMAAHDGSRVRVAPLVRHILSQQIGGTMQDYRPTTEEVEALIEYENTALNVRALRKLPSLAFWLPRYRAAKRGWKRLAEKIISLEQQAGPARHYLSVILNEGLKHRPQWFTEGDIRAHAVMPYIAGSDTVGATMTFALLELFKQPKVRAILQNEVDEVFGKCLPDVKMLDQMVNLKNFCREVLRLYPTVYVLNRTATRDFVFEGHLVRKGQQVIIFSTAGHTDSAYFKDPYKFDIDRYKEPRSEYAPPGAIAPFGAGAHSCMGAGLANAILLPLNVAFFLHYTDVAPANDVSKLRPTFWTPQMTVDGRFAIHVKSRQRDEQRRVPSVTATPAQPSSEQVARPAATQGCPAHKQRRALSIVLHREACQGHGICVAEAPELFCIGADGRVESIVDIADGPLALKASAAATYCPTRAIRVVPRDGA